MSAAHATGPAPRLWPFAALSASYFAHIGFFNPYLPLWLKEAGYGLFLIGLLTSLQSATRLFAPYAWGWISDHTGERVRLLRYGGLAALALSLGLWWDWRAQPVVLFALLLLMFTHTSAMMPMSEAALAHAVSHGGGFDARRYGRVRLWGSLGFLVTVMVAGAWFEFHGMGSFPFWTAATLLAVCVSAWFMPDHKEAIEHGVPPAQLGPVLRQAPVRWFFVAVGLHVLSHVFVYVFFSLYLDALGYSKTAIGLLWAASVAVEIAWFYTQGRWMPRLALPQWLVLAAALMLLRMVMTAGGGQWWWCLLLAQGLHGITFAAHHTVCIGLLNRHFPGRLRGRGQALYAMLGYGLPGVTAGLVGGWASARWGLASVFWMAAGAAALAWWSARRLQTPRD